MMKFHFVSAAILAAGLFAGCSTDGNSETYDTLVAAYSVTLDTMETTETEHYDKIQSSSDLPDAQSIETSFQASMADLMDEMMGTANSMDMCAGTSSMGMEATDSETMDSDSETMGMGMSAMSEDMEEELASHHDAMMAAGSLDDALQEEMRHQEAVNKLFEQMQDAMDQMMGMMGMDCQETDITGDENDDAGMMTSP